MFLFTILSPIAFSTFAVLQIYFASLFLFRMKQTKHSTYLLEQIHLTIYDDICWWFQNSPEVARSTDISARVTLSDADKL